MIKRDFLIPLLSAVVICLFLVSCEAKKDRSAGHPHRGLLDKLSPGRFDLKLSSNDESDLSDNKAVMKHVEKDGGKGGTAICGMYVCIYKYREYCFLCSGIHRHHHLIYSYFYISFFYHSCY